VEQRHRDPEGRRQPTIERDLHDDMIARSDTRPRYDCDVRKTRFAITRIDHVQLAMPAGAEAEAQAFYEDVLGLERRPKPPALAVRGGCWFESEGVRVHLGVETAFVPARKAHPAFRVADLDAMARDLAVHGFPVRWSDELPERRFYVDDPFGNRLEMIEEQAA
jgi:catechol 2,3-dioxygenase-like lactoylglutathione lyase family enzyme